MELAETDLYDLVFSKPPYVIGEAELKPLMKQVVNGLEFLHDNHVAHRDIKPENILIHGRYQDIAKLTDYSLVREADAGTISTSYLGTPGFMAPEIVLGPFADFSSFDVFKLDIWALGITIYRSLTNTELNYKVEDAAVLARELNRLPPYTDEYNKMMVHVGACGLSWSCSNLIAAMLQLYRYDRANIKQVKGHPWFN